MGQTTGGPLSGTTITTTTTTNDNGRRPERNYNNHDGDDLKQLDDALISHILSFCDISDLLKVLDSSHSAFSAPVATLLSTVECLPFSFLRKSIANTLLLQDDADVDEDQTQGQTTTQDAAVNKIIQLVRIPTTTTTAAVKYIECSNLRHLKGRPWLERLYSFHHLQSLDLSFCSSLDPQLLITFLEKSSSSSLIRLNLQGCVRVGPSAVNVISERHPQLQSLSLGGCSQRIANQHIFRILNQLRDLKHLDLQALNHVTDLAGEFMSRLPESLESFNLSACQQLRLSGMEALETMSAYMTIRNRPNGWNDVPISRHRPLHIVLDAMGTPRVGLCRGILTYFALGRNLREVHLAGAEQVQDWEVEALAQTCGHSLTCFQMRASSIGNASLEALARYCRILAEVDVSACFQIGDAGVIALCSTTTRRYQPTTTTTTHDQGNKRFCGGPALKVLKVASLPDLSNVAVAALANLTSLHVLDLHDCPKITSTALATSLYHLPKLIDVNAKGITDERVSLFSLLRDNQQSDNNNNNNNNNNMTCLRFVNQRVLPNTRPVGRTCCSVRLHSQRLSGSSLPMQAMWHCVDCKLIPDLDRGICESCVSLCHRGHKTFVGSWTRFYCDCPFGITQNNECKAIDSISME